MTAAVHPRVAQLAGPEPAARPASADRSDGRHTPGLCTNSLQSAGCPASELANSDFTQLAEKCRIGWVKVKGWPWWPVSPLGS